MPVMEEGEGKVMKNQGALRRSSLKQMKDFRKD